MSLQANQQLISSTSTFYGRYRTHLTWLLAAILALTLMPPAMYYSPDFGLDLSWMIAIHNAVKNHLVFGREFVFTYGPLAVLQTRFTLGVSEAAYFLFDAFFILNFLYVFQRIMRKSNLLASSIIILICIWALNRDVSIMLLWLILFYVFDFLETRNLFLLLNLLVISVFLFFLKLSTGFIPPFIATLAIVYGIRAKVITYTTAGIVVALYTVMVLTAAYILNVDLIPYVSNGLHIVNGYNDAMYVPKNQSGANPALEWALLYIVIFLATGIYFFREIIKSEWLILLFVCSSLFLYVLFKVSFVRFHIEIFFAFTTPLYGFLLLKASAGMKKVMSYGLGVSMIISVWALQIIVNPGFLFPVNTIRSIANAVSSYYRLSMTYPGDSVQYSSNPADFQPPKRMMDSIGNHSVDIIPYDIAVLTSAGMNYRGRPIIQSYSVHDGHLDQLNADFYESAKGPEYVLYRSESIDGRYAMFDESRLTLELLKNYASIDPGWNNILLKRLRSPLRSSVVKTEDGQIQFGQRIELSESDDLQLAQVKIEYSWLGKIIRMLYQPPDLSVTLFLADGSPVSFRCVQPNVRDGIIIDRYVPANDPAELDLFVNSNGAMSRKVRAVKFHSSLPSWFKKTISYTIDHHRIEGPAKDLTRYEPSVLRHPVFSGDSIAAGIDLLEFNERRIEVEGWAYNKADPSDQYSTYVTIGPVDSMLTFRANARTYRPDIAGLYKVRNDSSGFRVVMPGNYKRNKWDQLGILLVDSKGRASYKSFDHSIKFDSAGRLSRQMLVPLESLPVANSWLLDQVEFHVQVFSQDEDYLHLNGWAFPKANGMTPETPFSIYILLENGLEKKIFKTTPQWRPDVSEKFGNNALDRSGFDFEIGKNSLTNGSWKLSILTEFAGAIYTAPYDETIIIENNRN